MEVIEIKSAKTFLRKISLENEKYSGLCKSFIFRGQKDAEWEIIPSAFRKNSRLFNESGSVKSGSLWEIGDRINRHQIEAEFYTIEEFCHELNNNGFHVPNEEILNLDGYISGHIDFTNKIERCEEIWPPKKYHAILAIAQHYGIPTRFVDWSYDPFVAAYFAAIDSIKSKHTGYLSVYATNTWSSNVRRFDFKCKDGGDFYFLKNKNKLYQLVKTPAFFNANMKAQKGVFMAYVELNFKPNDEFVPFSFEDYLKNSIDPDVDSYKYVLCASKSEELLSLLNKRFYNSGFLFPSIEGCVRSLYESRQLI